MNLLLFLFIALSGWIVPALADDTSRCAPVLVVENVINAGEENAEILAYFRMNKDKMGLAELSRVLRSLRTTTIVPRDRQFFAFATHDYAAMEILKYIFNRFDKLTAIEISYLLNQVPDGVAREAVKMGLVVKHIQ